ncbi:PHP domain-containing protein [Haliovirga abyssi]|uniref:Phosphatase n=1 Tax=Haliovirga abyssi TaxID=2996794 RepID=A0AAU9DFE3_9FUSO|nr:PHP domain-containing protein [Haliovirga abyssi]BDU50092.1 phosphatase [Haliovirga abyssi]
MIDLHIHTTCSDGTYTPEEVVELCKEKNIEVMAITDHDTVEGLKEGRKKAEELGITFINGIEFSTDYYGKEVHILGYFLNIEDEAFLKEIKLLGEEREKRTELMLEKLKRYGINITMEDVLEEVKGNLISRTHIAGAMYKKGYIRSRKEAFINYIGSGKGAYIPKENLSPARAVKLIKDNGGLAFVAHPKLISLGEKRTLELLDILQEVGLDGLEIYYPSFSSIDIAYYSRIAKERGLIASGGSDFHGGNRIEISIGVSNVKNDIYEAMLERLESQKNEKVRRNNEKVNKIFKK